VAHSAIIIGLGPILVLVCAAAVKLEHLTARRVAGMLIALAGVAVLKAFEHRGNGAGPTWVGDFCIFLAALAFAFFTVFGKPLTLRHSSITVNAFAYVGGGLALLPAILWESRDFDYARVSLAGWSALFYMAMFPSLLAYLIYYYALRRISASRVSAFSYLQPLVATVLGVVLLHETVTVPLVAGGAVIFTGVWVTEHA
jgi:drug/metabolite transporter (DMT)-like permease